MEIWANGRRRIDKVLSPEFVADLEQESDEELRARREKARKEEADVSYLRRMLQGRLEIIEGEVKARKSNDSRSLVERLTESLTVQVNSDVAEARVTGEPERLGEDRRLAERMIHDVGLAQVSELDSEEAAAAVAELKSEEASVSEVRRRVHAVIDTLNAELGRRKQNGGS